MKKTRLQRTLSLLVCIVLIAATALHTIACSGKAAGNSAGSSNPSAGNDSAAVSEDITTAATALGDGATIFALTVTDAEGKETAYTIHTDEETVGSALLALDLIAGESGPYGLYIKTVAGITVDYERDGKYWAFYINGAYATAGVDATPIDADAAYALKVE